MFRYVKDFFKTLSMEIGGVKTDSADLTMETHALGVEVRLEKPEVWGISGDVEVLECVVSSDVQICSASFDEEKVDVIGESFDESSVEVSGSSEKLFVDVDGERVTYEADVVSARDSHFAADVMSEDFAYSVEVKDGLWIDQIWDISYTRSKFVEKEKILEALAKLLRRYGGRPERMEFLGYFKNVPIGMARSLFVDKGRLVLRISPKKKRRNIVVDLVAIRTPKGVMVEVVR